MRDLFPSSEGHESLGMSLPGTEEAYAHKSHITKWLITNAFQRKTFIKRGKCERKIKMELVLLGELSEIEQGGH